MTTRFSPAQLQQIVTETLPTLEDGHTSAIIGTVDSEGAQVVARFKLTNNHWTVTAAARHQWTGEDRVGATVLLSW